MAETPGSGLIDQELAQTGEPARQDRAGSILAGGGATSVSPKIGPWYPPSWARRPPGMPWDDWVAWQPWLQGPGQAWTEYAYNVRLYTGDPDGPVPAGTDLALWRELNAKRIDALGRRGAGVTIFEARRVAGWSAIAQLLGYRTLMTLNYPELEVEALYLITTQADTALRVLAQQQHVEIWTAPG